MTRALPLFLSLAVSAPALAASQLPTDVMPLVYDITVRPDAGRMTFSGEETVSVDVRRPARTVVLNAADLAIAAATFDGKPVRHALDAATQRLTLTLPAVAATGRHTLAFRWTGTINTSASGLFASDYVNTDGSPARMLATQFEAPDARRFAPMWDEPAFKARFRLSATAPAGQTAFSNTAATAVTAEAGGGRLFRFAETPLMSSYLLFLGIGDVERKTVRAADTQIGVISRRGVVDQGDYGLGAASKLLGYYNDYFGIRYPLAKLDMIAGPGSSQFFSAMENWGAIFYFENQLLLDPQQTGESGRQRIHTVIAHEMAHQWFGDLVTMRWWDDLWLNEGFATWMEGKATNDINPDWKAKEATVVGARETAMAIDATAATHPIIRPIETVDQIGEAFDGITYSKGQAVIGMLEAWIGADAFRTGVRRYMARYQYGNTVTDQLWAELSAAAAGKPVAMIANDFTRQGGVPLVTMAGATCARGVTTVRLAQTRFALDAASRAAQGWHVPLRVATLGGGTVDTVIHGADAAPVRIKGCGAVVLNQGKQSYTRVLYDAAGHDAIVRDYPRLALADRLGTLGDDFALAAGGYQDLSRYFAVQARIGAAADPLEWSTAVRQTGTLIGLYEGTPLDAALRARSQRAYAPVLERIGLTATPGESPRVSTLRETLLARLGADGDARVVAEARRSVPRLASDPAAIPASVRASMLSTYALNATPADWDRLLAMAKAERNPVARNRYVAMLGGARNPALARRALALVTATDFSDPQRASLLRAVAAVFPDMAFDWAVAHRDTVDPLLETSSRTLFIPRLGSGSSDPAMPGRIRDFARAQLPPSALAGVERVIAAMAARRATADRLRAATQRWASAR